MKTADVVIVGAGFAGAATAYFLSQRGAGHIVLLEREKIPGKHASGKNAALAFTSLADPAEARLACEGLQFLLEPPPGFADVTLIRRTGSLLVSSHREAETLFQATAEVARGLGLAIEVVQSAEITRAVPLLRPPYPQVGLLNLSDGVVDIHALLHGYLRAARRNRVEVLYDEPVVRVDCERGRILRVHTRSTTYATRCLVNAAGPWAGEIAAMSGAATWRVEPRRRHLFIGELEQPVDPNLPFVWHSDADVYFRPESGGLLMSPCDATPHPATEPSTDDSAKVLLAEKLLTAFPSLADARIRSSWACLRTFSPDERFVIGRDPAVEGFVWVACLGGHGMTTSAAVGRLAAAAVCGDRAPFLDALSPARFTHADTP